MRARSKLTTGRLWLVVVATASSAFALASCVIDFPTLTVSEGGTSDASASDATSGSDSSSTDAGTTSTRFCEGGSNPPACDDFDDDNYLQDGAPVVGTSGCKLYVVGDDYLSAPRSLEPSTDASAGCQAFLGFLVPLATTQTIIVNGAIKVSDFSVAATPRSLVKITSPDGDTLSVQLTANGLIANVAGTAVTPASPQQPGGGNWFHVEIDARLQDGTFDLKVNGMSAIPNHPGITAVKKTDAGDAGKPAGPVTIYFGADRPSGEPDTTVHIDNITILSQ
jgi:hypothetical protein